jgi:hypothetical protein
LAACHAHQVWSPVHAEYWVQLSAELGHLCNIADEFNAIAVRLVDRILDAERAAVSDDYVVLATGGAFLSRAEVKRAVGRFALPQKPSLEGLLASRGSE